MLELFNLFAVKRPVRFSHVVVLIPWAASVTERTGGVASVERARVAVDVGHGGSRAASSARLFTTQPRLVTDYYLLLTIKLFGNRYCLDCLRNFVEMDRGPNVWSQFSLLSDDYLFNRPFCSDINYGYKKIKVEILFATFIIICFNKYGISNSIKYIIGKIKIRLHHKLLNAFSLKPV